MSNLFGTDGIRGTVGHFPLTQSDLNRLGNAIGAWLQKKYGSQSNVLIAHDTRFSNDWLLAALASGMLLSDCTLHHAGTLPTPAVSLLIQETSLFDCGIVISASHNPFQDNGIKIVDRSNGKLSDDDERMISSLFFANTPPSYISFGTHTSFSSAEDQYIHSLLKKFKNLSLSGKKIVLDCAYGATYRIAPIIFSALGAEVIPLHTEPNGKNINHNCGALELAPVQDAVQLYGADVGCAFDGDGDRVILVNKNGLIKSGDDILALLSTHPLYQNQKTVVGTVMANIGLHHFLFEQNKKLVRTPVGDRWVAQYMLEHELLLGGEQSGHIILGDYLPTGDGIATALRVIETIHITGNWDMNSFTRFPQKLINVPVKIKKDLKEPTIAAIIAKYEKQLHSGRLFIRYSGTENVLRIMVEDSQQDAVARVSRQLAQALKEQLQ